MLYPVIMAGGSGTRFWPRSRRRRPKQLIQIVGTGSMIQQTVARLRPAFPAENIRIITHQDQAQEMLRQLPELKPWQVLAEPCGRDTAACVGLAAHVIHRLDPDGVMAMLSADHAISPAEEFVRCLQDAARIAIESRALVTFGIRPSEPSEMYGYIRRGEPLAGQAGGMAAYRIAEFKEKPSRAAAAEYLRTGDYYWNSGNFVWRAADMIEAIERFLPELHAGLLRIAPHLGQPDQADVLAREYPSLPRTSIDYGIMEKAANAVVVEATFQWDDVGSWESIVRHQPADHDLNHVLARHSGIDTRGCVIVGEGGHLIATLGVENLIIVHTPDATLVCDRRRAAEVKGLVELLRSQGLEEHL